MYAVPFTTRFLLQAFFQAFSHSFHPLAIPIFILLAIPTLPNVRPKVRYPVVEASQEWDWQHRRWHIDGDTGRIDTHQSVVVLPMVTPISAGGGGTALLTGSHRTVARWLHDSVSQPLPSHFPEQPILMHLTRFLPIRARGGLATTAESAPSSKRRSRPRSWGRSSRRRATLATCWYAHNVLTCVVTHAHACAVAHAHAIRGVGIPMPLSSGSIFPFGRSDVSMLTLCTPR